MNKVESVLNKEISQSTAKFAGILGIKYILYTLVMGFAAWFIFFSIMNYCSQWFPILATELSCEVCFVIAMVLSIFSAIEKSKYDSVQKKVMYLL